jgi:hypothetical protein
VRREGTALKAMRNRLEKTLRRHHGAGETTSEINPPQGRLAGWHALAVASRQGIRIRLRLLRVGSHQPNATACRAASSLKPPSVRGKLLCLSLAVTADVLKDARGRVKNTLNQLVRDGEITGLHQPLKSGVFRQEGHWTAKNE